jgi:hypothetical protein
MRANHPAWTVLPLLIVSALVTGCAKKDAAVAAAGDTTSTQASSAPAAPPSNTVQLRGTVQSVTAEELTLTTPDSVVHVALEPGFAVYTRANSDLAHVTPNSFIGVTSVAQPDGSQKATEIHVFPEAMRGTGEGSRPMGRPDPNQQASTMTNGTVSTTTMTNGTVSQGAGGSTMTVTYNGGSQTISVPADVPVTVMEPIKGKLDPGAMISVRATLQPDGTLRAASATLGGGPGGRGGPGGPGGPPR